MSDEKKPPGIPISELAKGKGFKRQVELLRTEPRKFKTLKDATNHAELMRALEIEYKPLQHAERNETVVAKDQAADAVAKLVPHRSGKAPSKRTNEVRRLVVEHPKFRNDPTRLWALRSKEIIPEQTYASESWGKDVYNAREWMKKQKTKK